MLNFWEARVCSPAATCTRAVDRSFTLEKVLHVGAMVNSLRLVSVLLCGPAEGKGFLVQVDLLNI